MDEVADVAAPFYNNDLRGGEGHMEVGKLILNVVKSKATMTLSVKPFGCMPSGAVSDGVQSLITERYPGTIFCAVETSGDGAVNFQSRVSVMLRRASATKTRARPREDGHGVGEAARFLKENRVRSGVHKCRTSRHHTRRASDRVASGRPDARVGRRKRKTERAQSGLVTRAAKDEPANAKGRSSNCRGRRRGRGCEEKRQASGTPSVRQTPLVDLLSRQGRSGTGTAAE